MMRAQRHWWLVLLFACVALLVGVVVMNCGEDKGTEPPPPPPEPFLEEYVAELPAWPDTVASNDIEEVLETSFDGTIFCRKSECSMTRTPEKVITYGLFPEVLWLGALIQGNDYADGLGSMEELPIRERAPLTIAMTCLGQSLITTVEDPRSTNVLSAIGGLVTDAENSGYVFGSGIDFEQVEMHSLRQVALGLGLSSQFLGIEVTNRLDVNIEKKHHTLTIFFRQVMFETFIDSPPTPSDLFSAEFTQEKLDEQVALGHIGPDNLPVYVSSIQWGRMMMATISSDSSLLDIENSLRAQLPNSNIEFDTKYAELLATAEIGIHTWGGEAEDALAAIRSGNIADYFNETPSLTTAFPLAYKLRNLADNSLAKVSETTTYEVNECTQERCGYFSNYDDWEAAFDEMVCCHDTIFFPLCVENVELGDGVPDLEPRITTGLGSSVIWYGASTGFCFDFELRSLDYGCPPSLIFDDYHFQTDRQTCFIAPGGDGCVNDDFLVSFDYTGADCFIFAFGINTSWNSSTSNESFTVFSDDKQLLVHTNTDDFWSDSETWKFMGVVSMTPIDSIVFDEGLSDGSHIILGDFWFGVAYPGEG